MIGLSEMDVTKDFCDSYSNFSKQQIVQRKELTVLGLARENEHDEKAKRK